MRKRKQRKNSKTREGKRKGKGKREEMQKGWPKVTLGLKLRLPIIDESGKVSIPRLAGYQLKEFAPT